MTERIRGDITINECCGICTYGTVYDDDIIVCDQWNKTMRSSEWCSTFCIDENLQAEV